MGNEIGKKDQKFWPKNKKLFRAQNKKTRFLSFNVQCELHIPMWIGILANSVAALRLVTVPLLV